MTWPTRSEAEWCPESLRPHARAARDAQNYMYWRWKARSPLPPVGDERAGRMAFIIGCGRSGTTILGRMLDRHPGIRYLNEPYDRWVALDPRTDVTHRYLMGEVRTFLGADDASELAVDRFWRLFRPPRRPGRLLLEKSPANTLRIGYLNVLAPRARYVVIVRDARAVINSIAALAGTGPEHRISGRPNYDAWWGVSDCKWLHLSAEAEARGLMPPGSARIVDDHVRAAWEWVVNCEALADDGELPGDRVMTLHYEQLVDAPGVALRGVADFLGVAPSPEWLQSAEAMVELEPSHPAPPMLPSVVCERVNEWQARYGYPALGASDREHERT